jgi:hypothetical protein
LSFKRWGAQPVSGDDVLNLGYSASGPCPHAHAHEEISLSYGGSRIFKTLDICRRCPVRRSHCGLRSLQFPMRTEIGAKTVPKLAGTETKSHTAGAKIAQRASGTSRLRKKLVRRGGPSVYRPRPWLPTGLEGKWGR